LDVREDLTGKTSAYTKLKFDRDARPFREEGNVHSSNNNNNNNNNEEGGKKAHLEMEMMLHVAPLLPYDTNSEQQLHRKRHIGNDVVVVVFCEGNDPFNPEVLTSNYNHIFILCRPVPDDPSGRKPPTHFSVASASVRGVKPFRPYIPDDTMVPAGEIREWLLTKVLNAERGAMYAPEFSQKLSRTIQTVVGSWVDEF
jgi:RAP1 GTPase activating protein 1